MKFKKAKLYLGAAFLCLLISGCKKEPTAPDAPEAKDPVTTSVPKKVTPPISNDSEDIVISDSTPAFVETDINLDSFFGGIKGCAVIYSPGGRTMDTYNRQMSEQRVSPCSTFKIVSALIGLEHGIVTSPDSLMGYNGTAYPNEAWNADLTLKDAFSSSCIWYFRKILDAVGPEAVQQELDKLSYGNRDISQWEGSSLNPLPDLNGFWLESSLQISPREQVELLISLFEENTQYPEEQLASLKDLMLITQSGRQSIYGKTGTGNNKGWFVGFIETGETRDYFAVYLDDPAQPNITGETAKEIALKFLS